jgi:muramoyltetrapeptide carboxypeptidase
MIQCKKQRNDSCIGIFSPSEPITSESRRVRFEKGIKVLKEYGFQIKISKNAFSQHSYMAGTPEDRANDINELVEDNEVDILLTSWGGKSCNQILRYLNYDVIKASKKPILGFSDGCVLSNAITAKTGLITFSGPNVAGKTFETKHSSLNILKENFYENKNNLLGDPSSVELKVLKDGVAKGRLFGGNLSTFVLGLVGSEYMPKYEDGILFWESGGETPQIIDQFLTCLSNAGVFDSLRGMVIGDFIREEDESYKVRDPYEMVLEVLKEYSFPIFYCPTFGHPGNLENPAIPIGPLCELDTYNKSLLLLEPVIY